MVYILLQSTRGFLFGKTFAWFCSRIIEVFHKHKGKVPSSFLR